MGKLQRPPTTQEAVLAELRRLIQDGGLQPGELIRPDDVAREFGVSRIPVREALKILEGEGLVSHTPHVGYTVARLSVDEIVEIYDIRAMLETEALRRGAGKATEEDRAQAVASYAAAQRALESGDGNAFSDQARRFHTVLFRPCGMPRLMRLMESVWDSIESYRPVNYVGAEERLSFQDEHRAMLDAFLEGDAAGLRAAVDAHREHLLDAVLGGLPEAAPPRRTS